MSANDKKELQGTRILYVPFFVVFSSGGVVRFNSSAPSPQVQTPQQSRFDFILLANKSLRCLATHSPQQQDTRVFSCLMREMCVCGESACALSPLGTLYPPTFYMRNSWKCKTALQQKWCTTSTAAHLKIHHATRLCSQLFLNIKIDPHIVPPCVPIVSV